MNRKYTDLVSIGYQRAGVSVQGRVRKSDLERMKLYAEGVWEGFIASRKLLMDEFNKENQSCLK